MIYIKTNKHLMHITTHLIYAISISELELKNNK